MKRKLTAALLITASLLASCSNASSGKSTGSSEGSSEASSEVSSEESTVESSENTAPLPAELSIDELKKLDGVKSVTVLEKPYTTAELPGTLDKQNLLMTFEQPIDWNDPSKGTFEQRVQVCYNETDYNVFHVGGYELPNERELEFGSVFNTYCTGRTANYVDVEYRFFGRSVPKDLSPEDDEYKESLTSYNAACDLHHIFNELKKVLPGKWLMNGGSKGGITTMAQSMYFPEDADLYIPECAPICDGPDDDRVFKNIYETIGDDIYGKEAAAEYRKIVLDLQVELIKNRDYFQQEAVDILKKQLSGTFTDEVLYDYYVLSLALGLWDKFNYSYGKETAEIEKVRMLLPNEENKDTYLEDIHEYLFPSPGEYIPEVEDDPKDYLYTEEEIKNHDIIFTIQCLKEIGSIKFDFSYLRKALEEDGSGAGLAVTEDMDDTIRYTTSLPSEVLSGLEYDSSFRDSIIDWMNTTDCNVIMLYGDLDRWYPARLPDVPDRENFHTYVAKGVTHRNILNRLGFKTRAEVEGLIADVMGK